MIHRINYGGCLFISTVESVYWDFSCGNLEYRALVSMVFPLRKFFYCDREAGFSVAVHYEAAFLTTVKGVGFLVVGWVHRTASRTPFTRVVGVYVSQGNAGVDASRNNAFLYEFERDEADLSVGFSAFVGGKSVELFHYDSGVVFQREFVDFFSDLARTVPSVVPEFPTQFSESGSCAAASFGCESLEFASPSEYFGFVSPYALSEVELLQDFTFRRDDCDGEIVAVKVDAEDVLCCSMSFLLLDGGEYFVVRGDAHLLQTPTISKMSIKAFKHTVPSEGDNDRTLFGEVQFDAESSRRECEGFSGAGNVTVQRDSLNHALLGRFLFQADAVAYEIQDDLRMQGRFFADVVVNSFLEFSFVLNLVQGRENMFVEDTQCLRTGNIKHGPLMRRQTQRTKNDDFLHHTHHNNIGIKTIKGNSSPPYPCGVEEGDSLPKRVEIGKERIYDWVRERAVLRLYKGHETSLLREVDWLSHRFKIKVVAGIPPLPTLR